MKQKLPKYQKSGCSIIVVEIENNWKIFAWSHRKFGWKFWQKPWKPQKSGSTFSIPKHSRYNSNAGANYQISGVISTEGYFKFDKEFYADHEDIYIMGSPTKGIKNNLKWKNLQKKKYFLFHAYFHRWRIQYIFLCHLFQNIWVHFALLWSDSLKIPNHRCVFVMTI